jgi:hypothetical protein
MLEPSDGKNGETRVRNEYGKKMKLGGQDLDQRA